MNKRILPATVVLAVLSLLAVPVLAQTAPATAPSNGPELRTAPENTTTTPAAGATTKGDGTATKKDDAPQGLFDMKYMLPLLGAFVLLMWWSSRSKRKQEQKRREMLNNIKKGDKVTSIGGVIGSVIEVREDEVLVKVDENTRMKFARWAIRGIGEDSKAENPDQAAKGGNEKK